MKIVQQRYEPVAALEAFGTFKTWPTLNTDASDSPFAVAISRQRIPLPRCCAAMVHKLSPGNTRCSTYWVPVDGAVWETSVGVVAVFVGWPWPGAGLPPESWDSRARVIEPATPSISNRCIRWNKRTIFLCGQIYHPQHCIPSCQRLCIA